MNLSMTARLCVIEGLRLANTAIREGLKTTSHLLAAKDHPLEDRARAYFIGHSEQLIQAIAEVDAILDQLLAENYSELKSGPRHDRA